MTQQTQLLPDPYAAPADPYAIAGSALSFFVPGIPAPGGSKRAFAIKKNGEYTGRVAIVDASGQRTANWRQACVFFANKKRPAALFRGPLRVDFAFVMPRPRYHFHTRKSCVGELRGNAPHWHTSTPDRTKLTRSTEDALKGILFHDDAQIVDGVTTKRYGDRPGCTITVTPIKEVLP